MIGAWSRRRAAVAAEARSEARSEATERQQQARAAEAEVLEGRTDAELLAELDLPDPDTLDSAEALRRFLAATVPARLRSRALRRMWGLNPVLANLDGLVDYGEDFNAPEMTRKVVRTAYQVGRGFPRPEPAAEPVDPAAIAEETGADMSGQSAVAPEAGAGSSDCRASADPAPGQSGAGDGPDVTAAPDPDRTAQDHSARDQSAQDHPAEAQPLRAARRMRIRFDSTGDTDAGTTAMRDIA